MTTQYFPNIETWRIPERLVQEALAEMANDGRNGNEGIALFFGEDLEDGVAELTHLIKLRGAGIEKHPAHINITSELLNDVTDFGIKKRLRLIGQVHSHGPGFGIDLSSTDRTYGINAPNYLSLVAPDYALSAAPIKRWGAHVFLENEGYVRLHDADVRQRLQVIRGLTVSVVTIGGEDE